MNSIKITLEDIFNLANSVIYNPDRFKPVKNISIDSRTIKKGSLFVAIKGDKTDGHNYVKDAVNKGASAVIISKKREKDFSKLKIPVITVNNTTKAYGQLANTWRKKLDAKVIGLTGSNGKTTTKEMLATLLSAKYTVTKSVANNNNHIGVPLTIISANEKTDVLILEEGTNHFGEIEYIAKISEPDIALITNIGDTHLEFLLDRDGVYKEKSALLNVANEVGGTILINNDDPYQRKNKRKFKNVTTYGFKGKVDLKGKIKSYSLLGYPEIEIFGKGKKINVMLPLMGEANVKNYLSAVAIAITLGLTKKEIVNATKKIQPVKGRLNPTLSESTMLIDDSYNSNPDSVKAAVDVISKVNKYKRKIMILGDMLELGKAKSKLHADLKESIIKGKIDEVYMQGKLMNNLYDALPSTKIATLHFTLRESLKRFVSLMDINDAVILVKGSRGMKMEEFVEIIKKRLK
ncbi:udp-n-acetylmuramoylalanyl-d-glutamyl-2,6- diaminopimelate--d-alanyl-d-alanine ligase [hydrocarbon metagenome]|uniref:UDP-MurNAc-pentapeptide synthetase n=1 Tax=hydrocarbon metagenome TaxID=938273 RepID=A0A0W8FZF3_9ZZZZ